MKRHLCRDREGIDEHEKRNRFRQDPEKPSAYETSEGSLAKPESSKESQGGITYPLKHPQFHAHHWRTSLLRRPESRKKG